jgi:hypothetical protein
MFQLHGMAAVNEGKGPDLFHECQAFDDATDLDPQCGPATLGAADVDESAAMLMHIHCVSDQSGPTDWQKCLADRQNDSQRLVERSRGDPGQ